jgi:hypothetical protein
MAEQLSQYREISLPDGNKLQIKFEGEGIVYDIIDKQGEVIEELGYDIYQEDVPVIYKQPETE